MKIENIDEAAAFIVKVNCQPQNHVGYIGTDVHEIKETLLNDSSDLPLEDSVVCWYDEGELVGVFSLDYDQESKSAELWGPFTSGSDGLSKGGFFSKKNQALVKLLDEGGSILFS